MHSVDVLALDGVLAFDLSTPVEVFGRARVPDGRAAYWVRICALADEEVDAGVVAIRAPWGLGALGDADTIIVPGLADPAQPIAAKSGRSRRDYSRAEFARPSYAGNLFPRAACKVFGSNSMCKIVFSRRPLGSKVE